MRTRCAKIVSGGKSMFNAPNRLHDGNLQSFIYLWRQRIVCWAYFRGVVICFEKYCSFSGLEKMPNVKMKFRQNYLAH